MGTKLALISADLHASVLHFNSFIKWLIWCEVMLWKLMITVLTSQLSVPSFMCHDDHRWLCLLLILVYVWWAAPKKTQESKLVVWEQIEWQANCGGEETFFSRKTSHHISYRGCVRSSCTPQGLPVILFSSSSSDDLAAWGTALKLCATYSSLSAEQEGCHLCLSRHFQKERRVFSCCYLPWTFRCSEGKWPEWTDCVYHSQLQQIETFQADFLWHNDQICSESRSSVFKLIIMRELNLVSSSFLAARQYFGSNEQVLKVLIS